MSNHDQSPSPSKWYHRFSDPMVLIFLILVATYLITFIVPAGSFERIQNADGQTMVVPNSFKLLSSTMMLHPFDIFIAIPKGLKAASQYLFIVFIAGGLFHILQQTGTLENAIGTIVRKIGIQRSNVIIVLGTLTYGFFGVAVGFENNIALIPVASLIAHAIGYSYLVGVAMAVGGIGIGFALSPINPYTVGVAQKIAELPPFSGYGLRTFLVLTALLLLAHYICTRIAPMEKRLLAEKGTDQSQSLSKSLGDYSLSAHDWKILGIFLGGLVVMLIGIFAYQWYIDEIAGLFILMAILIGLAQGLSGEKIVAQMMVGASGVTAGALVIGLAASIQIILEQAQIIDTFVYGLSTLIQGIPPAFSAIISSVVQGIINLFVPSGSGQAMITMPILIPLADLVQLSRQLMITAFQIGDGLTNLIVPTSGGTLAMLALGKVSYEQWLKIIMPFMIRVYLLSWAMLLVGYYLGY